MARVMALGADWCNAARGFMFAVGCIQAQSCHTGDVPDGRDLARSAAAAGAGGAGQGRAGANFHHNTIHALAELVAAAGLDHPEQLGPHHFLRRGAADRVVSYAEQYDRLQPGELLVAPETAPHRYAESWRASQAASFTMAAQDGGMVEARKLAAV